MKRSTVFLLIILLLSIPGCGLFQSNNKPVKIAAIINMSGPAGHMKQTKDGIDLAVEEINSAGGINGHPLEIIYRDNKSNPQEAVKQFTVIENVYKPLCYLSTSSSCSTALAEPADKNRVVVVGLMTSSDEFPRLSPWVIRYYFTSKEEAKAAMKIIKMLKIKTLGFLYQNDEFGKSVYKVLLGQEDAGKFKIFPEPFNSKSPSLRENIKKLLKTEALYIISFGKRYKTLIPEIRGLHYKGHIITHSGASTNHIIKMPDAENIYVAAPLIYNPHYSFANEFSNSLVKKFSKKANHYNAIGYDIIKLVTNLAIETKLTRENIHNRLTSGFVHPGIFGNITAEKGSNDIGLPLYPARITEGKLHYLK